METPIEKSPIEILSGLANLLAKESDQSKSIRQLVRYVKDVLDAEKACAVVFSEQDTVQVFCDQCVLCAECGDTQSIIAFAKRMTGITTVPLIGDALLSLLTESEKNRLNLRDPIFFPIAFGDQLLGAMWYDIYSGEQTTVRKKDLLDSMYPFISLVFRNAYFYESQRILEQTLTRILDNLDANIYVSDLHNDDILFINKKMIEEFGLKKDIRGEKCWKVLQEGMTERCDFCPSYRLVEDPSQAIVWEEHNTATRKYYKNTDSVIQWVDGRLVHLQHSVDITPEKAVMRHMEEARSLAELASQAKGDFLSRMSHEIRTPINAIIGMSRIAAGSADISKNHDCIRKIDSSSKQLLAIVNDILDISKIEANKMELVYEPFDFEQMLIDVSNVISIRSEEKRQKLHIHMDMSMPKFFRGDEMRLSQVITNLLSNAVKFTPPAGSVTMGVREIASNNNKSIIEVRISDTGIGIPKARQGQLFRSFEQADGGIARKFGGTGLGLSIAKSIVEMMNGDISLESETDTGSIFTFTVELEHTEPPETATTANLFKEVDVSSLRVLLVDEDAETRDYFGKIMDSFNMPFKTTATFEDAFRMLSEAKQMGESFNIIFLDWATPSDNTASKVCLEIKKQFGSSIIVLVSFSQWSDVRPLAEHYGITKYLAKPLFPSTILNVIHELVGLPASKSDMAQTNRYRFSGYHLLMAEDVEINREIVCQALEDSKIRISSAPNGLVALTMFMDNPTAYDIILMDVNMPEMDGYEATRRIRALPNEWAKQVPILAMTANAFKEDVRKSLENGMNDHISKPLNFNTLFSKLHHYLSQHPRSPEKENPETPSLEKPASPETWNTRGLVNVEEALARLNGNANVYKTLLSSFLRHSGFDELTQAINAADTDAAQKATHALKGVSGNLSLVSLYKDIVALEDKLKIGRLDMALYQACLDNFEKTRHVIHALLEKM